MARLVGLVVLWAFWGPPPALAGSGRVKLISKVPPTVRVCGGRGAQSSPGISWRLPRNVGWSCRTSPVRLLWIGSTPKDLAAQAVDAGSGRDSFVADAAGPETFTFEELVRLLTLAVGARVRLVHTPPAAGVRTDPAGRPAAAGCGADQG